MRILMITTFFLMSSLLIGCDGKSPEKAPEQTTTIIPSSTFMTERPADVVDLIEAKKIAKVGDKITFLARVGGRAKPFVENQAIFLTVDPSLESCEIMSDDGLCGFPWDYCCEDGELLRNGMATIRITGDDGRPLRCTAEEVGGLETSKFVVVEGVVNERNNEGLFIVDASRIWIGGKPTFKDPLQGSR